MFAILFAIISTIFVYRAARDNGYNKILWTIASLGGFLGIQLAMGLIAGIFVGIGIALWDWSPTLLDDYSLIIGLLALMPSVAFVLLILKYVNRVPEDGPIPKRSSISIFDRGD